jgi:hypothetical protein
MLTPDKRWDDREYDLQVYTDWQNCGISQPIDTISRPRFSTLGSSYMYVLVCDFWLTKASLAVAKITQREIHCLQEGDG